MTTNGAAKYSEMMRSLRPEVIVVEEAAEVTEASIVASLTKSTKHLILIGDHLQLRPQITEYNIATFNGLDVSLFERLVLLGVKHVTLSAQRRMHPDISSLITPSIYKRLQDAPQVLNHPRIQGVAERLFFITHNVPEDGEYVKGVSKASTADMVVEGDGKVNSFEAKYIMRLLEYLLYNGYNASQIVVLSMYKRQVRLIKDLVADKSRCGA